MMVILVIKDLSIKRRQPILSHYSATFPAGQIYGIVAPNGSGKTTFFRVLMGLVPASYQELSLAGKPIISQQQACFYFEDPSWFDLNLSANHYLRLVHDQWHSHVNINEIVAKLDMADYLKLPIRTYSLGMKQRTIIAMYLISDAKLLLMDEVTNGLDEASRHRFFGLLRNLSREGKLILLSSHYQAEIEPFCDHLLFLRRQRLEVHLS